MRPVLNYPGSKQRIAHWIINKMPLHHSYVEPFFGSGAVLLNKKPSQIETANDLDDEVVNLFKLMRDDPKELIRCIEATPYSRKEYDLAYGSSKSDCEKARKFLVRCWQGHGFRTTGVKVGWKNDVQGRESAYALRNWNRLPEAIVNIVDRLKHVQIENRPAIEVINRFNYKNVLIYCDPPYVLDTRAGKQYKHEMTTDDHETLLKILVKTEASVMISGYAFELYEDMLSDWVKESIATTAEHGQSRTECLWMNFDKKEKQLKMEV